MNPLLAPEVQKKSVFRITLFIILTVALLGSGAFALQKYFEYGQKSAEVVSKEDPFNVQRESDPLTSFQTIPRGSLVVSYVAPGSDVSNLYAYDYEKKSLIPVENTKNVQAHAGARDGKRAFGYSVDSGTVKIEIISGSNVPIMSFDLAVAGAVNSLLWNEDGSKLLVSLIPKESKILDEGVVYLLDTEVHTAVVIGNGGSPLFYRDQNILLFRADGLYQYDLDSTATSSVKIYTWEDVSMADVLSRAMIDEKYKNLVASFPSENIVVTFKIEFDPEHKKAVVIKNKLSQGTLYSVIKTFNERFVVYFKENNSSTLELMKIDTLSRTEKSLGTVSLDTQKPYSISF